MGQKEVPVYAASRLGMYNRLGNSYQYEMTDHLGNVRVVINGTKQSNGQTDVITYSDYYPFGSPLTLANNDYRYGYQGQYAEVDKETGWNNFELRMYDPAIGRWMTTDPYGQYDSPYLGMGNNPVSSIDPDGGKDGVPGFFGRLWNRITKSVGDEITYTGQQLDEVAITAQANSSNKGFWGGFSAESLMTLEYFNQFNPAANVIDAGFGYAYGEDRFGKKQSSFETNVKLASAIPIGKIGGVVYRSGKLVIGSFDALVAGLVAKETKAGLKFGIENVGVRRVYKDLRKNGYDLISNGVKGKVLLNPNTGEQLLFRVSNSGGYKGYDSITTMAKGMNMTAFFK